MAFHVAQKNKKYNAKMGVTMDKKAIIFIGIQASGKTTFYNQFFCGLKHINLDTIHTRSREKTKIEACHAKGLSYVIDNTNPRKTDRARYISAAKQYGYKIIGYYFRSSVKESAERNAQRENAVPRLAIAGTAAKLELPDYEEGFDELFYVSIKANVTEKTKNDNNQKSNLHFFEAKPWQKTSM